MANAKASFLFLCVSDVDELRIKCTSALKTLPGELERVELARLSSRLGESCQCGRQLLKPKKSGPLSHPMAFPRVAEHPTKVGTGAALCNLMAQLQSPARHFSNTKQ